MSNTKRKRILKKVIKINKQLLAEGSTYDEIMEFWEECLAEAQIQNTLPACSCKDVNDCKTWCRAKARFAMNPPGGARL